ncbi:MAG: acyl-CoA dehydrogenase, partial [Planctomycetes bacterium]|nr:acyl-CoA dehydrogenase [Planctomycetota bacterium]
MVSVPFAGLVVGLGLPPVRRALVTPHVLRAVKGILPTMSETEQVALDAGTVWWDAELFSGAPDWSKLEGTLEVGLSEREQEFLDGPVEELCRMSTDWEIEQRGDLPPEVWDFVREKRFFGMIIPQKYGGLEFSAQAHSAVVAKVASRSTALAVTVMVPNSLGPAELLLHYGTEEQKDYFLPRLASGEEIPCFALTEPGAGSDAGSIASDGVVCRGEFEGREVLGIRLNWNKRYITLAPVATILGLAFQLRDPDGLLGGEEHLGITCALIPTGLPGVHVGDRHDPMGSAFMNGPTTGEDVFVPIDSIIGGQAMAGRGWMMLMQCLSVGRGISLPSLSAGGAQLCALSVGAYATIREQFGLAIGKFEGVQEALARIGGKCYAVEAIRQITAASVDAGEKPSVVSAIAKCYATEQMRQVVTDAMDVFGGAGISQGPANILGGAYRSLPIGITVEGANILTRTMIIFGQGALRCHPFAQHEIRAAATRDVPEFDRAFFGHVGFVFQNAARALVHGLTGGLLASSPIGGPLSAYYQGIGRMSAAFAIAADVAMGTLGGALKRMERLTGRLADTLSWMYIASACLEKFRIDGRPERDEVFVKWVCEHALYE